MYPFMNDFQNFGAEFISMKIKELIIHFGRMYSLAIQYFSILSNQEVGTNS